MTRPLKFIDPGHEVLPFPASGTARFLRTESATAP